MFTPSAGAREECRGEADRLEAVFHALADPTRRYLIETISESPEATSTSLASGLPISRQAVSKHLAALADAGLVEPTRSGRETRYRLGPRGLGDAASWIAAVGAGWDRRLARLERMMRNS